ncbi:hypothetical protein NFI96_025845, partial [Prochilodus magdalenae]
SGDSQELRRARRELTAGVKRAKAAYALKIQGHFSSQDPRSMWRGIKCITDYKTRDAQCSKKTLPLPEALNKFYARFEDPDTPPSIRLTPTPGEVPLSVTPAEVRRTLRRLSPPEKVLVRMITSPDEYYTGVLLIRSPRSLADIFQMSPSPRQLFPPAPEDRHHHPGPQELHSDRHTVDVTVDPHQYAYRRNRSTDDAISSVEVHTALTHLEQKGLLCPYALCGHSLPPSTP